MTQNAILRDIILSIPQGTNKAVKRRPAVAISHLGLRTDQLLEFEALLDVGSTFTIESSRLADYASDRRRSLEPLHHLTARGFVGHQPAENRYHREVGRSGWRGWVTPRRLSETCAEVAGSESSVRREMQQRLSPGMYLPVLRRGKKRVALQSATDATPDPQRDWTIGLDTRDELVRNAHAAGMSVDRIDALMRIGPETIRRILAIDACDDP